MLKNLYNLHTLGKLNLIVSAIIVLIIGISLFSHIKFTTIRHSISYQSANTQEISTKIIKKIAKTISFDHHVDVHFSNEVIQEKKEFIRLSKFLQSQFKKHSIKNHWMTLRLKSENEKNFILERILDSTTASKLSKQINNKKKRKKYVAHLIARHNKVSLKVDREEKLLNNRKKLNYRFIEIKKNKKTYYFSPILDETNFNYSWLAVEMKNSNKLEKIIDVPKVWFFAILIIVIFLVSYLSIFILTRLFIVSLWDKFL